MIYDFYDPLKVDVFIPRSLDFLPKSELHKHLQQFCTQQSVFSETCLAYGHFQCPLYGSFLLRGHPKFKGLSAHEYYLGIPLKNVEYPDENDSGSDSDFDD